MKHKHALVAIFATTAACQAREPGLPPQTTTRATSIDVGAIVERVRMGFGESAGADGFVARSRVWDVAVRLDRLTLRDPEGGAATFRTTELLGQSVASVQGVRDDARRVQLRRSAEVVETIESRARGVEQSWKFATAPGGEIIARVRVEGTAFVGATSLGLHFRAETGAGLRYGTAFWIDARGLRTRIDPTWTGDAIEIRVPREVADASTFPAVLDPTITPELLPDQPLRRGAEPGIGFDPHAAYGAGVHLVVFTEPVVASTTVADSIRAIRVRDSDGAVLDARPIHIDYSYLGTPNVAFDGTDTFLVVYDGTPPAGQEATLRGKRVRAADGAVLDAAALPIAEVGRSGVPAISFGDGRFLVTWGQDEPSGDRNVYGRLLDASGTRLGAGDFVVAGTAGAESSPVSCFADGRFLVSYRLDTRSGPVVRAQRVRASNGALLDRTALAITSAPPIAYQARCATNGDDFLVAWTSTAGIYARSVESATGVVGATALHVADSGSGAALAHDGTNYLVAWADGRTGAGTHIYAQRISPAITLLDGPATGGGVAVTTSTSSNQYTAGLTVGPAGAHVTWNQTEAISDLYGQRIAPATLAPLDVSPTRLSYNGNPQIEPAVGYGGGNYLVAWYDKRHEAPRFGEMDLVGVRVRAIDQVVLDPLPIEIIDGVGTAFQPPAIASDGTTFLVGTYRYVASSSVTIVARRLRASDGVIVDAAEIPVEPGSMVTNVQDRQPRLAASYAAGNYVLTWPRFILNARFDVVAPTIVAARFDAVTGSKVGATTVVLDQPGLDWKTHSLACSSATCLVVAAAITRPYPMLGGRVDASSGAALDPAPIELRPNQVGVPRVAATALAFDGTHYLLVWQTDFGQILMRRLLASGAVGPPEIQITPASGYNPALAFDGTHFVVAWSDGPNSGTWQVRLARILSPLTVVDVPGIVAGESRMSAAQHAVLASNGHGQSLTAYSRFVADPDVFTRRVVVRVFANDVAPGGPCTTGAMCASGFCVDDVCCDTECGGGSGDCMACSILAGASQDGVCEMASATTVCRGPTSTCDPVEMCSGSAVDCPPDVACPDAGAEDAGIADLGVADTGAPDDVGVDDLGVISDDASVIDAGLADAGLTSPDASLPDASLPDASLPDASLPDASLPEASVADAGTPVEDGGCSCETAPPRPPVGLLSFLVLAWISRRRAAVGARAAS